MHLPADAVLVISGSSYQEIEWLRSCITATFGHNIVKLPIRLSVELIKNYAVGVETVLIANISRQHLINTARRFIYQLFMELRILTLLLKKTHPNHIGSNIKNNGCLVSISH